jgi:hypothetical protein
VSRNRAQSARKPDTKAERRAQREHELAIKQEALPSKKYGVILAGHGSVLLFLGIASEPSS